MNVAEMLEQVGQEVMEKPDRYHVLNLLNEALNLLVMGSGGVDYTDDLYVVEGTAKAPSNLITPVMLTDGQVRYRQASITEYETIGGEAFAVFDGTFYVNTTEEKELTLHYWGHVETLVGDTDEPNIEAAFHYLLPMYATAMLTLDKGKSGERRLERFEAGRGVYGAHLLKKRRHARVKEVNIW